MQDVSRSSTQATRCTGAGPYVTPRSDDRVSGTGNPSTISSHPFISQSGGRTALLRKLMLVAAVVGPMQTRSHPSTQILPLNGSGTAMVAQVCRAFVGRPASEVEC